MTLRLPPAPALRHRPPATAFAGQTLCVALGDVVRALRMARGWTLQQLAERSDLSVRYVVDIENGHANPSLIKLAALASAFGMPLSTLVARAEPPEIDAVIALLGLRGAGKSTLGTALASRLCLPFFELDALIEEAAGLRLAEIFALHGEPYYRKLELETLERFLTVRRSSILATSGGIVGSPAAFGLLERACTLVWLKARPEEHLRRVQDQGDERPMHNRPHAMTELCALLRTREPLYARARITVDTSTLGIEESVQMLTSALQRTTGARHSI